MKPLGQRTYLAAKAKGDNSMSVKAGYTITTNVYVCRGPGRHGEGCACLNPECLYRRSPRLETVVDIQDPSITSRGSGPVATDVDAYDILNTLRGIGLTSLTSKTPNGPKPS